MKVRMGTRGLLAGVVLGGLLAAGATLALAAGGNTITVCVSHKSGTLYSAGHCKQKDHTLTWNIQGQPGPAGSTGATGPAGPSAAYASSLSGPVSLPSSLTTIASLSIPQAGDYAVFAKAIVHDDVNTDVAVTCQLVAGGSYDYADVVLSGNSDPYVSYQTPALQLTNDFTSAGTVNLECDGAGVSTDASWIKITAIRVGSLTSGVSP